MPRDSSCTARGSLNIPNNNIYEQSVVEVDTRYGAYSGCTPNASTSIFQCEPYVFSASHLLAPATLTRVCVRGEKEIISDSDFGFGFNPSDLSHSLSLSLWQCSAMRTRTRTLRMTSLDNGIGTWTSAEC